MRLALTTAAFALSALLQPITTPQEWPASPNPAPVSNGYSGLQESASPLTYAITEKAAQTFTEYRDKDGYHAAFDDDSGKWRCFMTGVFPSIAKADSAIFTCVNQAAPIQPIGPNR